MDNKVNWHTCIKCGCQCTNDHDLCTHFTLDDNGNVVCEDCWDKESR